MSTCGRRNRVDHHLQEGYTVSEVCLLEPGRERAFESESARLQSR